jgi:2-(1,2-epoxy-1,2-dihydrophenyl)acetyl-CoA isomerase
MRARSRPTMTAVTTTEADEVHVRYGVRDHVATLTINRPERLNALTAQTLRELRQLLEQAADDRSVRVVVLTGAGRAFSAGGDFEALATGEMTAQFVNDSAEVIRVLHGMRPVTIAAVNGACAGGGMALACATDFRIAAESAFFTTAYLRIGTPGDLGLPWFSARLVGPGRAKWLSLLSERVPAVEAERIGLVERVVPDSELAGVVAETAATLTAFAPLALASLKQNLNDATQLPLSKFLEVESVRFAENSASHDAAEGYQAMAEHRPPFFRGE